MKPFLSLLALSLTLFSCHTRPIATTTLTETAIYNIDSVRMALNAGDEKAARKQLATAIDTYKNKKDPAASVAFFRKAILTRPSAQAYYELGCALVDAGGAVEAISALRIAEKLEYKPLANVMYKLSAAYASIRDEHGSHTKLDSVSLYVQLAIQMGYANPDNFRTDNVFNEIRYYVLNSDFKDALNAGHSVKNPELVLWEEFRQEFPPVQLPLTINKEWVASHPKGEYINYDYERFVPEMRNDKFSREVSKSYYYFATIKQDTAYTALCYAGRDDAMQAEGDTLGLPNFYTLVTFSPNGKIIDKKIVAGQQQLADFVKVFTIQPNYTFEVREFRNIYQQDPEQAGYGSGNPIIKTEEQLVTHYRIAADGKFEKTDAPLAIR